MIWYVAPTRFLVLDNRYIRQVSVLAVRFVLLLQLICCLEMRCITRVAAVHITSVFMILVLVIIAVWGPIVNTRWLGSPSMLPYFRCNVIVLHGMIFVHEYFDISYFILPLPYPSSFRVPDVSPNRLSNSPAVALFNLLLRSRRNEPEWGERAAAKGRRSLRTPGEPPCCLVLIWTPFKRCSPGHGPLDVWFLCSVLLVTRQYVAVN